MGRPKGSKNGVGAKSPYADLPEDWKNSMLSKDFASLDKELANVAKAEDENQRAKKDDVDLASLKAEVKEASAQYREATKTNKLKTRFLIETQETKGRPAAS